MSKLTDYTLEIYKLDRRVREGRRLIEKIDFESVTPDYIQTQVERKIAEGFVVLVHETYVTKRNLISGAEFRERYDTPHYCSPSSESYWSA